MIEGYTAEERDAERYRKLREALYRGSIDIGEANLRMKIIGNCPTSDEFDAAIDDLA